MNKLPERSQIPDEMKWNLEDIFASETLWEKGYQDLLEMIQRLGSFKGRLHESSTLLEAIEFSVETEKLAEKIYAYARMHRDEDNASSISQAMAARALTAFLRIEEEVSYMAPELLAIPQNEFVLFFDQTPGLKLYKRHLMEIVRKRKYVLPQNEEHILALTGEMSNGFRDAFTMLNNADLRFGTLHVDNEEVEITHGRYGWLLRHPERHVREETYHTYYSQYEGHKNTISSLLSGALKADLFYTRARGYASTMEASLFDDNVPTTVYHRLIDATKERIGSMHRYISIKKKVLSLEKVHFYDLYAPLTKDVEIRIDYGQACNIVKEALLPLGEEYAAQLEESFGGRWIDVEDLWCLLLGSIRGSSLCFAQLAG
jgi:oligoendopeptidase F